VADLLGRWLISLPAVLARNTACQLASPASQPTEQELCGQVGDLFTLLWYQHCDRDVITLLFISFGSAILFSYELLMT